MLQDGPSKESLKLYPYMPEIPRNLGGWDFFWTTENIRRGTWIHVRNSKGKVRFLIDNETYKQGAVELYDMLYSVFSTMVENLRGIK